MDRAGAAWRAVAARMPILRQWRKELAVGAALLAVLVGPFVLRPAGSVAPSSYDRRLVIITPHHEKIRQEFGRAFAKYWKDKTGELVFVDWRVPGGTSEIAMFLKSEFTGAFQYHWQSMLSRDWTPEVAGAFMNPKVIVPAEGVATLTAAEDARKAFLESDVGIGIDLFFGGGPYDFQQQADAGVLVARDHDKPAGLGVIREKHPGWFSDAVIPEAVSGESFRDKSDRWTGTCLSTFGIVFNRDVLRRLGVEKDPTQWSDLANPKLRGQVALADPTKSGSVTKAFEMLIQQEMQRAIARLTAKPGKLKTTAQIEASGVREGWVKGLQLIQRISANARYFTDSSTKIPLEVARGDAAAGMCIDFYGRATEEEVTPPGGGRSRVGFITPEGGTSVAVDPIGMLRGAPEPELASAFMEFVLSQTGQKLWCYRPSIPGGPQHTALRRLPVRRDMYKPEFTDFMSDGNEQPYEKAKSFVYHPEWTAASFNAIRFLIRVMCVDTHVELRETWQEIVRDGPAPRAMSVFQDMDLVSFDAANDSIAKTLKSRDKVMEVRLARQLSNSFRRQYDLAANLAIQGK